MSIINAIIFGIIQGLTEFLPISSSGHLEIIGKIFPSFSDPGAAFTAIIQIGTQLAVVVYFWKDIVRIIRAWFLSIFAKKITKKTYNPHDAKLGWLIILGTIPIVIIGILLKNVVENGARNLWITAGALIVFGVFLYLADSLGKKTKNIEQLNTKDGIIFGLAQCLALIPGVSRSGATITAGLGLKYNRASAARYSFLLSIPSVFGSGFYELYSSIKHNESSIAIAPTIVSTVISFIVGLAVIVWFIRLISKKSFNGFVIYRVLLGIIVFGLLFTGIIGA